MLGVPWIVWSLLALVVAVVFAFVIPTPVAADATTIARVILRWGHSVVWLLIALSLALRAVGPPVASVAGPVAALAGLGYATFVVTLIRTRA